MGPMTAALPLFLVLTLAGDDSAGSWRQFRGPRSASLAVGNQGLPTEIGPKQYVLWQTSLPGGHS